MPAHRTDRPAGRLSSKLLFADLTDTILGAFYATHTELGYGFLEYVYRNAVAVLLREVGRKVEREVPYDLYFHGVLIGRYRADLVVERKVVVEVKAARAIDASHYEQLRNYLRASCLRVGLLLNFGQEATFRRIIV
jgi:GxxExxY protein